MSTENLGSIQPNEDESATLQSLQLDDGETHDEPKITEDELYGDLLGSENTVELFVQEDGDEEEEEEGFEGLASRRGQKNVTIDVQSIASSVPQSSIGPSLQDEAESVQDEWVDEYRGSIDRNMYYELHTRLSQQYKKEKMKNNFLQTRLAAYYTKRKMMYVLRETTFHVEDLQKKYEKELEALEHLIEESDREKQMSEDEYIHLKIKRDSKHTELETLFNKLQFQENEYGKGLTYEKTGRHNMDKMVERFIKRQKTQTSLTMKLRSEYVKLQNKMNEKTRALEELDHLGPGFRIMDYVQLKSDNRDLHDKLDEKEGELISLRRSCQNAMQILAHNREKSSVIDLDIDNLKEQVDEVTQEYEDARQSLHYLIEERDDFRKLVKNLKMQYSLFINRKLLRDMEHSVDDLEDLKMKLDQVQSAYRDADHNVQMVRKNLQFFLYTKNKEQNASRYPDEDFEDL